jgi:hypothetical protein
MAWHVAHVRSGTSEIAYGALQALKCVDEVLAPVRTERSTLRGRAVVREVPWLGPLVLASWCSSDPHAWHDVVEVPQVLGILGGWPPACVPQDQVERLLKSIQVIQDHDSNTTVATPPCISGATVRFSWLAFYRLVARCVWVTDSQIGLRLIILGRDAVIPVPWEAIECSWDATPHFPKKMLYKRRARSLYAPIE